MSAPPRAGLFGGAKIKVFELLKAWPERGIEFVVGRFAVVAQAGLFDGQNSCYNEGNVFSD